MSSGCASETASDRLRIVATVAPLAGLVDRVAPGMADVTVMIPPGASPVTYEPSFSRVRAASSADLYVSVGHPAFAWESTWLADLVEPGRALLISAAEGCDALPDDPHVWLSLPCARRVAVRIAEAMQVARPLLADSISSSLAILLAEMDDLRGAADASLGPRRGGSFIVLHPAWGYLAREYGLQQMAILEHGSGDAGPAELATIVNQARQLGLRDVVVQPQFSAEAGLLVARELGGEAVALDPLARDWSSAFDSAVQTLAAQARP